MQGRLVDWGSKNIIAAAVQDIVTLYNGQNASDNTELENVEISNISALKWDNAGKKVRSMKRKRERIWRVFYSRYEASRLHQVVSGELVLRPLSKDNLDEPVLRQELLAAVLRALHLLASGWSTRHHVSGVEPLVFIQKLSRIFLKRRVFILAFKLKCPLPLKYAVWSMWIKWYLL